ncbi:MAG TPA: hypothetical protein VGB84_06005 [Arachidicoccus sp.]
MLEQLLHLVATWQLQYKTFALIDGSFDILDIHSIQSLNEAAKNVDFLIVAIHSDASVKQSQNLINNENDRALVVANLLQTDAVIIIDKEAFSNIVDALQPHIAVTETLRGKQLYADKNSSLHS